MNTELHLNTRGNPSGTPVFASSFLPLKSVSVQNPPRACVTRVLHGAADFHHNFTSQHCTLTNEKTARVHGVIPSDTSSLNTPACSRNVLQNPACAHLAPTHAVFSPPTSCQTDTHVWTAISTVNSHMYCNNRINHELTNFDFMPLVDSKVNTSRSMRSDVVIIEPEPAGPVISAFCGNTSLNDSETY